MAIALAEVRQAEVKHDEAENQPLHMSYEEFLAWADEDTRAEWVNGEVITFMPPKNIHQLLAGFLYRILSDFVDIFDLGFVQIAPFEVKLSPQGSSREPDVMFLAKDHLERLTDARIVGAPDLVVEIVSTDSVYRDRVDKFDEYQAAGIPEYWIIDNRPRQQQAYFFQLAANNQYQRVIIGEDGIYRSAVLANFWLRVDWLWQEHPNALRAIGEIIGSERVMQHLRNNIEQAERRS